MLGIGAAPEDGGDKGTSLADRFAGMAQAAYVKAGRGSLDLAGLRGSDIKGFVPNPIYLSSYNFSDMYRETSA